MIKFSKQEEERLEEVRELASMIDEDGFIKVVSSKRKSTTGLSAPDKLLKADDIAEIQPKKKKRKKEKEDFYRFQIREQKKKEMNDLLKRFQDDKRKVEELKEKKRFNPY